MVLPSEVDGFKLEDGDCIQNFTGPIVLPSQDPPPSGAEFNQDGASVNTLTILLLVSPLDLALGLLLLRGFTQQNSGEGDTPRSGQKWRSMGNTSPRTLFKQLQHLPVWNF